MSTSIAEDLKILEVKVGQLKRDYEHYFLGSRPREPQQLRSEVQKLILIFSNSPIQNTAERFRFNSINSRFQAFKRQWDETLRKIDAGTYSRHVFKARLHERERGDEPAKPTPGSGPAPQQGDALFESYREAAAACGQDVSRLTPSRLDAVVKKQEAALREKLGCEKVNFRVVVQDGKVKLKASPVRP